MPSSQSTTIFHFQTRFKTVTYFTGIAKVKAIQAEIYSELLLILFK